MSSYGLVDALLLNCTQLWEKHNGRFISYFCIISIVIPLYYCLFITNPTIYIHKQGPIYIYIYIYIYMQPHHHSINHTPMYRVIRNDCRSFNNLPPRSPDATSRDFFLWGYVKDQVYVPPLPASIPELKVRIRTAIETIIADMLQTVWNELDYHVDVCRITKGAHIEHL